MKALNRGAFADGAVKEREALKRLWERVDDELGQLS